MSTTHRLLLGIGVAIAAIVALAYFKPPLSIQTPYAIENLPAWALIGIFAVAATYALVALAESIDEDN